MRILRIYSREDYGRDYYIQLFYTERRCLAQVCLSLSFIPGWPYLQMAMGCGKIFGLLFWAGHLGLDIEIFARTWSVPPWKDSADGVA